MKTDQLTSLALLNADYDDVAWLFFQLHPIKIDQKNLVFQIT